MLLLPTVFTPMCVINVDLPKCIHARTYMSVHTHFVMCLWITLSDFYILHYLEAY